MQKALFGEANILRKLEWLRVPVAHRTDPGCHIYPVIIIMANPPGCASYLARCRREEAAMDLELNADERALILEVLLERERQLLVEISRSHNHQFREILRKKEAILESVLEKMREPVAA
jgi:hypothetical protein